MAKKSNDNSAEKSDPHDDTIQRLEELGRKLMVVSKEEIDHAEKNYQRRKKRREAKSKK